MPRPEGEKRRQKGRIPPEKSKGSPEQGGNKEVEPPEYLQVAYFANEHIAGHAYEQAQEALYSGPINDLSAYRLMLDNNWHVAVLGQQPPQELDQQLQGILGQGAAGTLPEEILEFLVKRRALASQAGEWVEGHHRPGLWISVPKRKGKGK